MAREGSMRTRRRAIEVGVILLGAHVMLISCEGGADVQSGRDPEISGTIVYVTLDPQKVIALELASGEATRLFENTARYRPDGSMPWVVGYFVQTSEIVLMERNPESSVTRLLAMDDVGRQRVIADFSGEWVTEVCSFDRGIGVVLGDRPVGYRTEYVSGSRAVAVSPSGDVESLIANVEVMEAPSCSWDGTCYVATGDERCLERVCTDVIAKTHGGSMTYLEEPRGLAPVVSPDGRSLAVIVPRGSGLSKYKVFDEVDRQWGAEVGEGPNARGVWSPDGRFFAYLSGSTPPWWKLEVRRVNGSKVGEYQLPYRCKLLAWLPS